MKKRIMMAALTAALFTVEVAAQDIAAMQKKDLAIMPFTGGTGEVKGKKRPVIARAAQIVSLPEAIAQARGVLTGL
jgi:hypothetical protein